MHAYLRMYVHTYTYILTLHCIALRCIALHCITLHYITYISIDMTLWCAQQNAVFFSSLNVLAQRLLYAAGHCGEGSCCQASGVSCCSFQSIFFHENGMISIWYVIFLGFNYLQPPISGFLRGVDPSCMISCYIARQSKARQYDVHDTSHLLMATR